MHLPPFSVGTVIAIGVFVVAIVLGLDHRLATDTAVLIGALAVARVT